MPDNSATLHEDPGKLREETVDRHRAIASIMEELEAVDWYAQRVDATADPELKAVLAHNRDEEKEHAAMGLEWLRRSDPTFDKHLRDYLFTDGSIVGHEEEATGKSAGAQANGGAGSITGADIGLGIGSLKGA